MQNTFELQRERFLVGSLDHWQPKISEATALQVTTALEAGQVVYLPRLKFDLDGQEQSLLKMSLIPKGHKNISYNHKNQRLGGLANPEVKDTVLQMMQRYHRFSTQLVDLLFPQYRAPQYSGRTSFRPVEIRGRKTSYRKDDTRLHVDAFPSTPVNNLRILRVFTNINPYNESRVWRLGEPFADVIQQFLPKVRRMLPFESSILYRLKITKKKRAAYDHYMLKIHNTMKGDENYQRTVVATPMDFPSGSTWIVYTDLVSHAALAGRFLLEQTFYPPVENMINYQWSPQYQIQALLKNPKA